MDPKQLDEQVEKILATNTVSRAQEIMSSRSGLWLIAVISFFEAATPIPVLTDPFLVAAIVLNRAKWLQLVIITTGASILGGVFAYYTAVFFLDLALDLLNPEAAYTLATMTASEQENIFILSLIGAFTPVPYTLTAWAVGALQGSVAVFVAASVLGRGGRYFIVGWLSHRFGPTAVKIARRYIGLTSILLLLLAAAFFFYKM